MPWHHHYRPTLVTALVSLAAVSLAPLTAGADAPFNKGIGKAQARVFRVGPSAGELALSPATGLALTDHANDVGRATSRAFDFFALEGSAESFLEQTPDLEATSADDDAGTTKRASIFASDPGTAEGGLIFQQVVADAGPTASARTDVGHAAIEGLVSLSDGVARSTSEVVGTTRRAQATVDIGELELGGGVVLLRGLHWSLEHRSGSDAGVDGRFWVEGLSIGGTPLGVPGDGNALDEGLGPVNEALAPVGLKLMPPRLETSDGAADLTPLRIRVADGEAVKALVAPLLAGIQPVREPVFTGLLEACDECKPLVLVIDVALSILTGGGRLDIDVGGVTAATRPAVAAGFSFGGTEALGGAIASPPPEPAASGSGSGSESGSDPADRPVGRRVDGAPSSGPVVDPTVAAPVATEAADRQPVALGVQRSDHDRGVASAVTAAVLIGGLTTIGVGASDLRRNRRRRRLARSG